MWYLHFRTADEMNADAARVRAGSLGLAEDRAGAHRDMWQAAQQVLTTP
jgi:hypothetical protein